MPRVGTPAFGISITTKGDGSMDLFIVLGVSVLVAGGIVLAYRIRQRTGIRRAVRAAETEKRLSVRGVGIGPLPPKTYDPLAAPFSISTPGRNKHGKIAHPPPSRVNPHPLARPLPPPPA